VRTPKSLPDSGNNECDGDLFLPSCGASLGAWLREGSRCSACLQAGSSNSDSRLGAATMQDLRRGVHAEQPTAVYCSGKCRKAAYRRRLAALVS
jgi:hypothetical protein